ncbi:hypothetical protein HY212_07175 [Candidatus Pacearchaeota archaeon]|nr:hypothetical protein [Candidatus Pacearchaeota archaeon]
MAIQERYIDHHNRRFKEVDLGDIIEIVTRKDCPASCGYNSEEYSKFPMHVGYVSSMSVEKVTLSNRNPFFPIAKGDENQPQIEEKTTEIMYSDINHIRNLSKLLLKLPAETLNS